MYDIETDRNEDRVIRDCYSLHELCFGYLFTHIILKVLLGLVFKGRETSRPSQSIQQHKNTKTNDCLQV